MGFVIGATSLVGLADTMTTNVLARTREIGIPLGYLLTRTLVWLVWEIVGVRLPVVFPLVNVPIALVGTVALALLVLFFPVRRAVRFRPGDALRYA